jgi:hypothetical protein
MTLRPLEWIQLEALQNVLEKEFFFPELSQQMATSILKASFNRVLT